MDGAALSEQLLLPIPTSDPTHDIQPMRLRQLWLLPYVNPFRAHVGKEFFKKIPRCPGIYRFYDDAGELLYVGKSKCLRARVSSYANAKPGEVSRKTIRLIHRIREVRWEITDTECAALLLENQLLREFGPPFNEANTQPQSYFFIGVQTIRLQGRVQLKLRVTTRKLLRADVLYGAFKGRSRVTQGLLALLRISHWLDSASSELTLPPRALQGGRPPAAGVANFPAEWLPALQNFFAGIDPSCLDLLAAQLAEKRGKDAFFDAWLDADFERLRNFFTLGLKRCREMSPLAKRPSRLLDQAEIDDILVLQKFAVGLR